MTLTLELSPDLEARLAAAATERGVPTAAFALEVLEKSVPLPEKPIEQMTTGEYILYLVEKARASMPEKEWKRMPRDYAKNFEHYLQGASKEEE